MNRRRTLNACLLVTLAVASSSPLALAADEPAKPAVQTTPAPAESAGLAGPSVKSPAGTTTLVERDMDGALKRLTVAPAEAAAHLLDLDEAARAKVNTILTERAALMDQLVSSHLRQIVELAGARQAGNTDEVRRLFREIWNDAGELKQRGTLGQDLARVLSASQSADLRRLTEEYMQVLITEEVTTNPGEGNAGRMQAVTKVTVQMLGEEIRRSYDRVVGQRVRELDSLLLKLQTTPEQESTIRRITGDLFQATYGKPTDAQRSAMFVEVWKILTPEQRRIVQEDLRGSTPAGK